MNIYILNILIVLVLALCKPIRISSGISIQSTNRQYNTKAIYPVLIASFLLMLFEMGLRGDFTNDTVNYFYKYTIITKNDLAYALSIDKDVLFCLVTYYFGKITDSYTLYLMLWALVIAIAYIKFINEESSCAWLSVLILLCSGSFYAGFNVMRQIIVASLCALTYKYIYLEKPKKFIISTVAISLLHASAIIMLPVYFIPKLRWKRLSKGTVVLLVICLLILMYYAAPTIANIGSILFLRQGETEYSFGISYGISLLGTLKAVVLGLIIVINGKYFDLENRRDALIYNGAIFYIIIAGCGFRVYMIQRFAHFFLPLLMIGYPLLLSRICNQTKKYILTVFIVVLLISSSLNVIISNDYYTYLNNVRVSWH